MTIIICPNCQQRRVVSFDTTDYVCTCNSRNKTVDNEDVVVTGDWEDFSGSGTKGPQEVMRQGIENQLQGTRAGIEGENKEAITRRGARASTHRQRQKLTYIDLKKRK